MGQNEDRERGQPVIRKGSVRVSKHFGEIREVVARLGVADVRAFGLTWEDCEQLLKQLGYSAHIHIEAT